MGRQSSGERQIMPLSRYLRMKIRSPSNAHIPKRNQINEQIEISLRWSAGTYSTSLGFHGCSWVGNSVLDNAGPYYASFLKAFTCIERLPASRRKNVRSSSVSLAITPVTFDHDHIIHAFLPFDHVIKKSRRSSAHR